MVSRFFFHGVLWSQTPTYMESAMSNHVIYHDDRRGAQYLFIINFSDSDRNRIPFVVRFFIVGPELSPV